MFRQAFCHKANHQDLPRVSSYKRHALFWALGCQFETGMSAMFASVGFGGLVLGSRWLLFIQGFKLRNAGTTRTFFLYTFPIQNGSPPEFSLNMVPPFSMQGPGAEYDFSLPNVTARGRELIFGGSGFSSGGPNQVHWGLIRGSKYLGGLGTRFEQGICAGKNIGLCLDCGV